MRSCTSMRGVRRRPARTAAPSDAGRSRCRRRARRGGGCGRPRATAAASPSAERSNGIPRSSSSRTRAGASSQRISDLRRRGWRRGRRASVSARCRSDGVVGGERGRQAALRPVAGRLGQRRARHERHAGAAARPRPARCRGRPRPAPHHGATSTRARARMRGPAWADAAGRVARAVRYPQPGAPHRSRPTHGPRLYLHHPSSLEHDTGDHPEQPARITRDRAGAGGARTGSGYERELGAARRARRGSRRCIRAAYVDRIAAISEQGGGMLDMDTVASARSFEAALHAAGGAVRAVEALLSRRGRGRVLRAAPARPPRRGGARDGLLPVQQRGDRRAQGARRPGRRARAGPRLGRAPRQRHERHLLRHRRGPVRQHPSVAAVSGHGLAARRTAPARARATRSTCPCRRARATRTGSRCSSTWSRRSRARMRRTCCSCRPASTPTATTRWRTAS